MPVPPKDPNPKPTSGGDPIRGEDWNNALDWVGAGGAGAKAAFAHRHTDGVDDGKKVAHTDLLSVTADQHHLRLHALSSTSDHSGTITESQLPTGSYVRRYNDGTVATGTASADPASTNKTYTSSFASGDLLEAHAVVDINSDKVRANAADEVLFELVIQNLVQDSVRLRYDATGAGDIFCLAGSLFAQRSVSPAGSVTVKVRVTVISGSALWRVRTFSVYQVRGTGGGGLAKE